MKHGLLSAHVCAPLSSVVSVLSFHSPRNHSHRHVSLLLFVLPDSLYHVALLTFDRLRGEII